MNEPRQDNDIVPAQVIAFWRAAGPALWFADDPAFDEAIRARFLGIYGFAAGGGRAVWEDTADGAFALLIVLDQFPRNMFRDNARAFASDALARETANRALARGFDAAFANPERRFFYLPFMHAENMVDQERCVGLCTIAGDTEGVHFAEIHADVIRRFGRFPYRNKCLDRISTPAEIAFLAAGGFAG